MSRSMILEPLELPLAELPPVALTPGQRAIRALFRPSFHPRLLVTLLVAPEQSHLEVAVGEAPERVRFTVDPVRSAELLHVVDGLDRSQLAAAPASGLDGMIAQGEMVDAGGVFRFSAWCPRDGSPQHAYFAALQRVAMAAADAAEDLRCRVALEHIHGHLTLGLPLKDYRGGPRYRPEPPRVRIFGTLSYPPSSELVSAIEAIVENGDALLLDLSNFQGMATALHPLFRKLTRRRAPTVYWASPSARTQLAEMGVMEDLIFDDLEDAIVGLLEFGGT